MGRYKRTWSSAAGALVALAVGWAGCSDGGRDNERRSALGATGGEVHGYVAVIPPNSKTTVRKANVTVFLKDHTTGTVVGPSVVSDAHGRYRLPRQNTGSYDLCFQGFGVNGTCGNAPITLTPETYDPAGERVLTPTGGVVWGTTLLADGLPCFHENAGMGVTPITTTVSLLDAANNPVTQPVTANDQGQYLLSGITGTGTFTLKAVCSGSTVTRTITYDAVFQRNPRADLTLPDRSPQLISVVGTKAGVPVRRATVGDTLSVTVSAADLDGDTLHYSWNDGSANFISTDSSTINWTVPNVPATAVLFVEVFDNKGGWTRGNLSIGTSPADPMFTGTAVADGGGALANVRVSVNGGAPVFTNSNGQFKVAVPEARRYVINGTLSGFVLASRVYYGPANGVILVLPRATRTQCDAGKPCVVTGKDSRLRVAIDPGTLVDKVTGKAASGPVFVDVFNFDLNRTDPMPGDMSGLNVDGKAVTLVSNGAINVDISDAAGNKYTIAPGKTAQISIPVDPTVIQQKQVPATIPLWEYDEPSGQWMQKASASFNANTNTFDGKVPGFSAWNADTVFTDTACIRFTMDQLNPPPFPFKLHVSIPPPAGPVRHNDFIITENVNGLFRLPANADVTFEIHPASGPDVVMKSITVKSGPAIDAMFQNPPYNGFPPFDFSACKGFDPASMLPGQPVRLSLDLPSHTAPWLSPSLSSPDVGSQAEAIEYYNHNPAAGVTIDPMTLVCTGAKCTLTGFQMAHGFATDYAMTGIPAAGETVTYFYNNGDLGLGREMHCKQSGVDAACYVTNYGHSFPPAAEPTSAIADAIAHNNPIATVAMEYNDGAAANENVQFFVYPPSGSLLFKAALDSEGPKAVPHICLACHGGNYDNSSHKALGASFREFDVFSYLYDQTSTGYTLPNQQENFRLQNQIVKATHPNRLNSNDPIGSLIDGMYASCGGVAAGGCAAADTYVPSGPMGWLSAHDSTLYTTVPRVYCRACHVAQPSYIDWTQPTNFASGFLQTPVCTNHDMPHAEVPFRKFWFSTNPHAPAFLADSTTGINIPGGCPP